ncbi:conjugation TrbI family protein [Acidithiobacillus sp. GGI-221]|nr:conjugation TrbI family protein [Acidithiobacillus sp. GGI-221]
MGNPQDEDILTPMPPRQDPALYGDASPQTQVPPPSPPRDRTLKAKPASPAAKGLFSKKLHIMAAIFLLLVIVLAFVAEAIIGGGPGNTTKSKPQVAAKKPLTVAPQSTAQNSVGLTNLLQEENQAALASQKHLAGASQNSSTQTGVSGLTASNPPAQSSQGQGLRFGTGIPGEHAQTSQSLQQIEAKQSQIAAAPLIALHGEIPNQNASATATANNTPSSIEQKIAQLKAQERASYNAQSQNGMSPDAMTKMALAAIPASLAGKTSTSSTSMQNAWQQSAKGQSGYGTIVPTLPKLDKVALYPGTIIPAVTVSRLNTQTPGQSIAQVTRTVYSNNGMVAIPAGSRLIGKYDGQSFNGQTRVMMSFTRVIFPDGKEIALGGMSGTGPRGANGLYGNVHTHFWTDLGASLLVAMITTGVDSIPNPNNQASGNTFIGTSSTSPTQAGAQVMEQQANNLLQPYSNIQPTITVPAGTSFRIMVNKTVMLPTGAD